jgi:hypothetical protein
VADAAATAPEPPDLIAAHRAFERGDFFEARRLAVELKRAAKDDAARAAADGILRRTSIDPVIVWLSAGCALFFVAVLLLTLGR